MPGQPIQANLSREYGCDCYYSYDAAAAASSVVTRRCGYPVSRVPMTERIVLNPVGAKRSTSPTLCGNGSIVSELLTLLGVSPDTCSTAAPVTF